MEAGSRDDESHPRIYNEISDGVVTKFVTKF